MKLENEVTNVQIAFI